MSCHSVFLTCLSSYFSHEIPPLSSQLYIDIFPPAPVCILSQAMFRLTSALSEMCSALIFADTWHVGVSGGGVPP